MPDRSALESGTRLGPYEILSLLGSGAMGVVYRARDTRLGREVALKVLPAAFAADPGRLQRFEREARAASALSHPNIVALHDVGTHDGVPFLVMELLEGASLREQLRLGPLPLHRSLEWAVQVAQGLAAAHAKGIVHRDVKPENLFVTREGRVKILDFGLAKPLAGAAVGDADGTLGQSESGAVLGTAGYMSPEQVRGSAVDARSDVFSFGAVLYEMLSGARAFGGATAVERGYAILNHEPPSFAAFRAAVPAAVDRVVRRCLQKAPSSRFQSAHDLCFALEAVAGFPGSDAGAIPRGSPRLRNALQVGAVVSAIGLAAFGASRAWRPRAASATASTPVRLPTFKRISFREGWVGNARFGPGDSVFYDALFGGGPYQVYEATIGKPEARPVGPPSHWLWDASRKGDLLLALPRLTRRSPVVSLSVMTANGVPREVADDVWSGSFGTLGQWEATLGPDGRPLALVRQQGPRVQLEFPVGKPIFEGPDNISWLRASPSLDVVAAFVHDFAEQGWIEVFFKDGTHRRLSGPWWEVDGIAWSPEGHEIWFAAGQSEVHSLRVVSLEGDEREVLTTPAGLAITDVDARGRALVLMRSLRSRTIGHGPMATGDTDLSWSDHAFPMDLATDGHAVLLNESSERAYLRPIDGAPPVELAGSGGSCLSPDGGWAAGGAHPGIWLAPTGAGERRRISEGELHSVGCVWSKDGARLVIPANVPGEARRLWVLPLDGGTPTAVSGQQVIALTNSTSPDGRWMGATYEDGGTDLVSLDGLPARAVRGLAPGDVPLDWSADGGALFVKHAPTTMSSVPLEIYRLDLATRKRTPWAKLSPPDMTGVDPYDPFNNVVFAADGKAYVFGYWAGTSDLYLVEGLTAPLPPAHER